MVAWLISLGGAVLVVEATTQLAKRRIVLRSGDVRKVMHTLTGLIFMGTWPNYPTSGRWVAASVPALMSLRFAGEACQGKGVTPPDEAVRAHSSPSC